MAVTGYIFVNMLESVMVKLFGWATWILSLIPLVLLVRLLLRRSRWSVWRVTLISLIGTVVASDRPTERRNAKS